MTTIKWRWTLTWRDRATDGAGDPKRFLVLCVESLFVFCPLTRSQLSFHFSKTLQVQIYIFGFWPLCAACFALEQQSRVSDIFCFVQIVFVYVVKSSASVKSIQSFGVFQQLVTTLGVYCCLYGERWADRCRLHHHNECLSMQYASNTSLPFFFLSLFSLLLYSGRGKPSEHPKQDSCKARSHWSDISHCWRWRLKWHIHMLMSEYSEVLSMYVCSDEWVCRAPANHSSSGLSN